MDFKTVVEHLQSYEEFQTLSEWTITPIELGRTSPNKYRFQSHRADYFVKEVTLQEQHALGLLHVYRVRLATPLPYPDLLQHGILVTAFISGGHMRGKTLPLALIADYAEMQNTLNCRDVVSHPNPFNANPSNEVDKGFYQQMVAGNDEGWKHNLSAVRRYNLPIVAAYEHLARTFDANRQRIADYFAEMPFGWLHNDFRAENILGNPPVVMDWGSSYGHGPFLFDLAPFLLNDDAGLEHFARHSHNCQSVSPSRLKRWLYVAGWARWIGFLRWQMEEGEDWHNPDECSAHLTAEYQTWKALEALEM